MKLDNKNSSAVREFEQWVRDELHGTSEQPSHEQPASARVGEMDAQWSYEFRPSEKYPDLGLYTVLAPNPDAEKEGVVYSGKLLAMADTDDEEVAQRIINDHNQHQHCVVQLQYLGNRAEELSSLLAGMTTERDGLREVLRQVRGFVCKATWKPSSAGSRRAESLVKVIDAALNHAGQGEGSD